MRSAHARVNLVEDDGGQTRGTTDECLETEHHAGYLTSAGHLRDRLQRPVLVGAEQVSHAVCPVCTELCFRCNIHLELHVGHSQGHEGLFHATLHSLARFLALAGEYLRLLRGSLLQFPDLLL